MHSRPATKPGACPRCRGKMEARLMHVANQLRYVSESRCVICGHREYPERHRALLIDMSCETGRRLIQELGSMATENNTDIETEAFCAIEAVIRTFRWNKKPGRTK